MLKMMICKEPYYQGKDLYHQGNKELLFQSLPLPLLHLWSVKPDLKECVIFLIPNVYHPPNFPLTYQDNDNLLISFYLLTAYQPPW